MYSTRISLIFLPFALWKQKIARYLAQTKSKFMISYKKHLGKNILLPFSLASCFSVPHSVWMLRSLKQSPDPLPNIRQLRAYNKSATPLCSVVFYLHDSLYCESLNVKPKLKIVFNFSIFDF